MFYLKMKTLQPCQTSAKQQKKTTAQTTQPSTNV